MAKGDHNAAKAFYELDNGLLAQLKEYSRETGRYETKAIEMVYEEFLRSTKMR